MRRVVNMRGEKPTSHRWEVFIGELFVSESALRQFARLNPGGNWRDASDALRGRLRGGHARRRARGNPRIQIVTGAIVPRDYIEITMRGRQVATVRKDELGQNWVVHIRRFGRVRDRAGARTGRRRPAARRAA